GAGRPARNVRIESLHRLDVRELQRRGMLLAGQSCEWAWSRNGQRSGAVGATVSADAVTLDYCHGDKGEAKRVVLYLQRTPCQYGGHRPWFTCPRCSRRVAVVCMAAAIWGCRYCLRVRYQSQSEDPIQRTWRRSRKIDARLAGGEDRPHGKPAGMRWATFDRLQDELAAIEEKRDLECCLFVARRFPDVLR
ncbi:MAG: hypothetical protein KGJ32_13535, partial [Xanthomonadaceae bacterium]|nr:hypothetical protein [Xanthomonadaceae bacterium]